MNKKDLNDYVCKIAKSTNADVIVLNEHNVAGEQTLKRLQKDVSGEFYHAREMNPPERFHCFCKNRKLNLSEVHSGLRTSVRKLKIGRYSLLLALVHGPDSRNYDPETRQSYAQSLAEEMRFVRREQGTNGLILLGDFNMNPYDKGMNLASCLNAMMTKACTKRGSRRHIGKSYDFYYNPMWNLFGDDTDGPSGTTYDISNQGPYGWSMLDQVIVNHSIVGLFRKVKIITDTGERTLMDGNGHPDKVNVSDHFPILVSLGEGDE